MRSFTPVLSLCAVTFVLIAASSAGAQPAPVTKAIAIIDDFEDGDLDGWAAPTGPCTAVNSSATGANGTSRSLKVDGACDHYQGPWFDLGGWQPTGVTFWVRTETANRPTAYVVLGDDNVATNNGAVFFSASISGYWVLSSAGGVTYKLAPYNTGQWYRVDLTLDWIGKNIDVSIDGVPRQYNVPFREPAVTMLTQLHFYNYFGSIAYLDEIQMSSPSASVEISADGFESADTTGWSITTPALPDRLVIFDGGSVSGAIGGRSGADVLCGQAALSASGIPKSATTRALISVSEFDQISDFPSRYGVPTNRQITGPNWEVIADDWSDLLDGSIDQSLDSAGAQTATEFWYTGSLDDGTVASTTCSGWTNGSDLFDGRYGRTSVLDDEWINTDNATCGSASYHVLCVAWR